MSLIRLLILAEIATVTATCGRLPPVEHASSDFAAVVDGHEFILTYEATHDVMRDEDPRVELLVLVHHDGRVNPVSSFDYMIAAVDSAAADRPDLRLRETTMVLAPAMIYPRNVDDRPERYADGHYPLWHGGWREGAESENAPTVSNFDLIDALLLHVANRFPNLRAVVQIGHSAGGQLVSRYVVGTTIHDELEERGIYMRSIIANPSSFLYLDRQRPDLSADSGFVDYSDSIPLLAEKPCRDFNEYPAGLDGGVPYMERRPAGDMLAAFERRDVWVFNGAEDNDSAARDMDPRCPAALQGRHRLERGRRYYEYLGQVFGPDVYESKFFEMAPGVGHSGARMFASDQGKAIIFIDADSAAAAMTDRQGRL